MKITPGKSIKAPKEIPDFAISFTALLTYNKPVRKPLSYHPQEVYRPCPLMI